jgi:hypothetical protein
MSDGVESFVGAGAILLIVWTAVWFELGYLVGRLGQINRNKKIY